MLRTFIDDTSGAVTVDWTILAAAVVGIGVSSVTAVRSGVVSLGDGVNLSLSGAAVVGGLRFNVTAIRNSFSDGIGDITTRNANGNGQIAWSQLPGPDGEPGVLAFTDRIGDATWISMGEEMTGDQSDKYGGALTFDLNVLNRSGSDYDPNAMVQITGSNGVTLTFDSTTFPATGEWTSYRAPISEGSWMLSNGQPATEAQIRAVLENVTNTEIRTEYVVGGETVLLDNVILQ